MGVNNVRPKYIDVKSARVQEMGTNDTKEGTIHWCKGMRTKDIDVNGVRAQDMGMKTASHKTRT